MRKINTIFATRFALLALVILFAGSCKKDDKSKPDNSTNGKTNAIFNSNLPYGTTTDQDGNTYKTIVIGNQTWMAENLRTTKYRNGDDIPEEKESGAWTNLKTGVYCNPVRFDSIEFVATYGRLYNWYAIADSRRLAPAGWHVCTVDDLNELIDFLGGERVAGGKLKEAGTGHWSLSIDASNESGFTALPAGYLNPASYINPNDYFAIGYSLYGNFWSATAVNNNEASEWTLVYNGGGIWFFQNPKEFGCSVRCVKD